MKEKCFECECPATINHHVVPQTKGGTKTVPLCNECHSLVHDAKLVCLPHLISSGKQVTRNIKTVQLVIDLYENGTSKIKIAKIAKINRKTVYAILERCGLHENTGRGCEIKVNSDTIKRIESLRKKQYTWKEIAEKSGISQTHMDRLIRKNNWSDGVYGGGDSKRTSYRKITDEQLEEAKILKNQGWKITKIAEKFGVNRGTLYNHGLHKCT